jgi:hypothetical protein
MSRRPVFIFCIVILAAYAAFGIFCLDVPYVKPDEAWILSRINYLLKYHVVGDPLFPKELSPFFATIFNAVPGSQFLGLIRYYSQAVFVSLLPVHEIFALRTSSFAWSMVLCLLTYAFARKAGAEKHTSLLAVTCLALTPEFFSQIHSERPEIMIAAAHLLGLLLFMKCLDMEEGWKKIFTLFLSGIYAWGMVIMIHGNAVVIPVTFGILYFTRNYKKIFTLNTVVLGVSLIAGFLAYYYLLHAPQVYSGLNEGGGGVMESQAPPIISKGIKSIFILPYAFYKKLAGYNHFAKPVSMLLFIASCASFFLLFRERKNISISNKLWTIGTSIVVPAVTLLLFSGSNGKFLIVLFPLCAILIAATITHFSSSNKIFFPSAAAILTLLFLSNFSGVATQSGYTKEYFRSLNQVEQSISDRQSAIIGSNFYYLAFKDQPYYSTGALGSKSGKPRQSFEEAVHAVNARYLILDDFAIHRIYDDRGKVWSDSMFAFLGRNCTLVNEVKADTYVGFITGDPKLPDAYPDQWKYPEQKLYHITKIRIYQVNGGA